MHRLHRLSQHFLLPRPSLPLVASMSQHPSSSSASIAGVVSAITSATPRPPSPSQPTAASFSTSTPSSSSPLPRFKVACIQMTSGEDMNANLAQVSELIRAAAKAGAKFIATPENTGRMTALTQKNNAAAAPSTTTTTPNSPSSAAASTSNNPSAPFAEAHPVLLGLQKLAQELDVFVLVGSVAVRIEGEKRVANRSFLFGPSPNPSSSASSALDHTIAQYDKIFMFDVPSLNGAESYLEFARIHPGNDAVLGRLEGLSTNVGMSICYDLRFPQLYRTLAQAGAQILTVPSAFTVVTGQAHWHALLRARAIENGCYVLAPAQVGTHPGDRKTYGHSLIISPWGQILADAGGEQTGFIVAEYDAQQVEDARRRVPSLQHDRPFVLKKF